MKMMNKIIKWNLAFAVSFLACSTLIYLISNDGPETIPVILLICLIFNGLITIAILHKNLKKSIIKSYKKQEGGGKGYEQENNDEIIADTEPINNDSSADNIY
ncbi:hypothetical protein GF343_01850 [Candidatus Woesearchaeota archaeon]|nr:hypothetical protein [Candidatus Woesearchaeota archaeon]